MGFSFLSLKPPGEHQRCYAMHFPSLGPNTPHTHTHLEAAWTLPFGRTPAPSHPVQALTPSSRTGVAVIAFGNKGLGNQHPTWGKPHCYHSNRGLSRAQRCQVVQV